MRQKSPRHAPGHGEKRSRRLETFIQAVLSTPSLEEAAVVTGIGRSTAHRWAKDPLVIARLREARKEAIQQAMGELQEGALEATRALRAVLRTEGNESVKVSASRCILEMALRAAELQDIEQRLGALEELARTRNKKGNSHDDSEAFAPFEGRREANGAG